MPKLTRRRWTLAATAMAVIALGAAWAGETITLKVKKRTCPVCRPRRRGPVPHPRAGKKCAGCGGSGVLWKNAPCTACDGRGVFMTVEGRPHNPDDTPAAKRKWLLVTQRIALLEKIAVYRDKLACAEERLATTDAELKKVGLSGLSTRKPPAGIKSPMRPVEAVKKPPATDYGKLPKIGD